MKAVVALLALAALTAAFAWRARHREPPDITEAQARQKAQDALEDFCLGERLICPDFAFKGEEPSAHRGFEWSYRFENARLEPGQSVTISIGKKGDFTLELGTLPPAGAGAGPPP